MHKVVIEDYKHMTIMDENVHWMELTHLLSRNFLKPQAPFCTFTFTSTLLIAFLNVQAREKNNASSSLMHVVYANASNNTPSYNSC